MIKIIYVSQTRKESEQKFKEFLTKMNPFLRKVQKFNKTIETEVCTYKFVTLEDSRNGRLHGLTADFFMFDTWEDLSLMRQFVKIHNNYKVLDDCKSYRGRPITS